MKRLGDTIQDITELFTELIIRCDIFLFINMSHINLIPGSPNASQGPRQSVTEAAALDILSCESSPPPSYFRGGSKPYTRWWWLVGPFRKEDISYQLEWLRANGFGGVELAWLWPAWLKGEEPGISWLGPEWKEAVAFTKQEADRLGLGCDFTLGSCWPFGGTVVGMDDASQTFDGPSLEQVQCSWEETENKTPLVLNHLDRGALQRYVAALIPTFAHGLRGSQSALFCDSLEINTWRLWDTRLWDRFAERFGYRLEGLEDQIDADPDLRYDYRTVIAEAILDEFYREFTAICHEHGAVSRVQCHGAPTDLLAAYAAVDIPESEAILFPPHFSRIAASAAAISGKTIVSAETFTCIYGFATRKNQDPYRYWQRENVADLKLLADALFAQGVNQIVWHGMPFNGPDTQHKFYASVHVGPDAWFQAELPGFNAYLEKVSAALKLGRAVSQLAVYLPNEDNRRLNNIPPDERTPAAVYRWEMRHVVIPRETEGYAPLWISSAFLRQSEVVNGCLRVGAFEAAALLIDVGWLDGEALVEVLRLANAGLTIILTHPPSPPGKHPRADFKALLQNLQSLPNVVSTLSDANLKHLVTGDDLPPFWARQADNALYLFFAHPMTREVRYPMRYGQSLCKDTLNRRVCLNFEETTYQIDLVFEPYQSLLTKVSFKNGLEFLNIAYKPPEPQLRPN